MTDLLWLSDDQLDRIKPYFPLSHGVPRVDDHRIVSGIVFVIKNGLRWRDAPREYGPHKTLYNRFIRWSRMGVFDRIFANLAGRSGQPDCQSAFKRNPGSACKRGSDSILMKCGRRLV